jgi:hypothetical protein
MEGSGIVAVLLLAAAGALMFYPASVDSATGGMIGGVGYHNVNCHGQLKRLLDKDPRIDSVYCERTEQKCVDIQPMVSWGDWNGNMIMSMGPRVAYTNVQVGFGLPEATAGYSMALCVKDDIDSGYVALYGNAARTQLICKKEFTT